MTPRAIGQRLFEAFQAAGAIPVDTDILQPAEILLDLYGEDIRARAYVTNDPVRGELMLRPDFTVPVVQSHMKNGADPARYCYLGEVFRKQDRPEQRPSEYLQVGYEVFDRTAPEQSDAEVFSLFHHLLAPLKLRTATGDIGILMAAVRGLSTSPARKSALLRHIWRPRRFRALLDRFSGRVAAGPTPPPQPSTAPLIGLRTADEISLRIKALAQDAATPHLAAPEAALLYDLLTLQAPAKAALTHLRGIQPLLPAIEPAVDRFSARLVALATHGIDAETLAFEASHGRTSLEYYDGFVFSFHGPDGLPPIASGGRYDALTAVLGGGASIPAVGGVIRPSLVAQVREAAAC